MGMVRLLLALSVVMAHASPIFGQGLVGGRAAVQCFFVISGFYITMILNQDYRNASLFYLNRALRIYPTYFVVMAFMLVLNWHSGPDPMAWVSPFTQAVRFLINGTLFFQDTIIFTGIGQGGHLHWAKSFTDYSSPGHGLLIIPPAWSISIELMFYLIAPFIVRRIPALLALFAASIAVRVLTYTYVSASDPWTYRFVGSEMAWFALGGLSYHLMQRFPALFARKWLGWIVTALFIYAMTRFSLFVHWWSLSPLMKPLAFVQEPERDLTCYTFILLTALALPFLFSTFRNIRSDRFLGDLSYPVYLCHMFVIRSLNETGAAYSTLDINIRSLITVLCACLMAAGLFLLVDRPVEILRQRIRRKARQPVEVTAPPSPALLTT